MKRNYVVHYNNEKIKWQNTLVRNSNYNTSRINKKDRKGRKGRKKGVTRQEKTE